LDIVGVSGSWLPAWRKSVLRILGVPGAVLGVLGALPGMSDGLDVSGSWLPAWRISVSFVPGVPGVQGSMLGVSGAVPDVSGGVPGMSDVSASSIPGVTPCRSRGGDSHRDRTFGNGSASPGLKSAYRDRATDIVGLLRSGRPTLQHQKDPEPCTGLDREGANAAAEKGNPRRSSYERVIGRQLKEPLGVESLDQGIATGLFPEARSRGTTPRVGNRFIVADGQATRDDTAAPPIVGRHEGSCYHSHPRL
jgi:hypothetical protein